MRREAKVISYDEMKQTLLSIPIPEDRFILSVLYATGARVGEVIGLQAEKIQELEGFIQVELPVYKKRKKAVRFPPISSKVERWLSDVIIDFSRGKSGVLWGLKKRTLQYRVGKYFNCTAHSFRHSRATHLLQRWNVTLRSLVAFFAISDKGSGEWISRYAHYTMDDYKIHFEALAKEAGQ